MLLARLNLHHLRKVVQIRVWANSLKSRGCPLAKGGVILCGSSLLLRPCEENVPGLLVESNKNSLLLLKHISRDWWLALLSIIFSVIAVIVNVTIPLRIGSFVNLLLRSPAPTDLVLPAYNLLCLYLLNGLTTLGYIYSIGIFGERLAERLKGIVFANILRRDTHFFDQKSSNDLVNRATADITAFKSLLKQCLTGGIKCLTQSLGSFVTLFGISRQLTVTTFVVLPAIVLTGLFLTLCLRELSDKCQIQLSRSSVVADEAIRQIRTVKTLSLEETEISKYHRECGAVRDLNQRLAFGIGLFQGLSNIAINCLSLAVIFHGGMLISQQFLTPGDLTAYMVSLQSIQKSLGTLSLLFGKTVRLRSTASLFTPMVDSPQRDVGGTVLQDLRGRIVFKDVNFAYPGRSGERVLKDVSLDIPAGGVVAFVGQSGGGKSTIVSLIERLYDVDGGCISVDDCDVRQLDLEWLRGRVLGYVSQEPSLFDTSIAENIRMGDPSASDLRVIEAAKLADAHEFIDQFPDGYDTRVGEEGVALSGGQKQRLAIARALIKDPRILIFDEATSALDSESERAIFESIEKISSGRTVIIVAHRLSTIRNSDLIYVVDGGSVVESGDHHYLMSLGGLYYKLVQAQINE